MFKSSTSENTVPQTSSKVASGMPHHEDVTLEDHDPELFQLLRDEKRRQLESIELIASENFTSRAVRTCLSSCATNKYSEGRPGMRYYGGNQVIDKIETLCEQRALSAFGLTDKEWWVNVQALSGSPANLAVFLGLLSPGDRVMGLALSDGGHLSHGFSTEKDPKFTAGAAFYDCRSYHLDISSGVIQLEPLRKAVNEWKPKLLIAGGSAYPRQWDWKWFRDLADEVGAYLLIDMAHISGLIAAEQHPSPFPFADVVTSTTHKSLRGPRSAMVFINHQRLGTTVANQVHRGVFPGIQGGPHNHQIAALCTQLKEVQTAEFRQYQIEVVHNCKALAKHFLDHGYTLVADGTDTHLVIVDTKKSRNITGSKVEFLTDLCNISLNKNTVPGDKSPLSPSGIRIGTPAMTSRGCSTSDMLIIYQLLDQVIELAVQVQTRMQSDKSLAGFKRLVLGDEEFGICVDSIKVKVKAFAIMFRMPGSSLSV